LESRFGGAQEASSLIGKEMVVFVEQPYGDTRDSPREGVGPSDRDQKQIAARQERIFGQAQILVG
jgi:hypothetical protein